MFSNYCVHLLLCVLRSIVRKRSQHGSSQKAFTMLGLGGWSWRLLAWPRVTHLHSQHNANTQLLSLMLETFTCCACLLSVLWSEDPSCSRTHTEAFSLSAKTLTKLSRKFLLKQKICTIYILCTALIFGDMSVLGAPWPFSHQCGKAKIGRAHLSSHSCPYKGRLKQKHK